VSERTVLMLVLVAAVAVLGPGVLSGPGDGAGSADLEGRVVEVVDGDTVHVLVGATRERVRYIGVDTPETRHPEKGVECYGQAASAYNGTLVRGQRVRLERDAEHRDRFGRLLAYVHRSSDGLFVNEELVRRGYARPLRIAPNVRHAGRFERLARQARTARRGLWGTC
jgi:micrococcal nuclease